MANERMTSRLVTLAMAIATVFAWLPHAAAQVLTSEPPEETQGIEVQEHPGAQLPLDVVLTDADGHERRFGEFFDGETPVIFVLAYYRCPILCTVVFDKMLECFEGLDYTLGEDFRVVAVSFDHTETTEDAAKKRDLYVDLYRKAKGEDFSASGWTFHTTDEVSVQRLSQAVGFQFKFLESSGEFSHPAALYVLSPDGKISRYIHGIEYEPRTVKLSLLEASEGRIAKSIGDRFLHFCYRYDPMSGSYTLAAMRVMRLGGLIMIIVVGGGLAILWKGEKLRKQKSGSGQHSAHQSSTPRTPGVVVTGHSS